MNRRNAAPISPARLKRIRWRGERAYRILSYSFSVRWNGELTGDHIHYAFRGFSVPQRKRADRVSVNGDRASVYSLVDLGPREPRRYRLLLADEQLISGTNADDVLNHLLYQILWRTSGQTDDFLLIHAGSVVSRRGEGVLLPADSGYGKTTLVAGLIRAGFGFLSDEIGVIDHRTGVLRPYPRALNFKEGALAVFPDLPRGKDASQSARSNRYVQAEEIRPDVMADPAEVRFIIAPRYGEGTPTRITPLSPAETVGELWANTVNHEVYGARALPILADVARQATGYRLVSGDLASAVRAVSDLTEAAETTARTPGAPSSLQHVRSGEADVGGYA